MAGERILVVDDEAVVHEIIGRYLQKEGYDVLHAYNGSEAMEVIYSGKPDLMLLDVLMPKLDGIEVCQEIRKITNIPILFVTSKDESFDMAMGFGAGGDDYIKKPFDPVEVIIRVKAHLRRYRQLRDAKEEKEPIQVLEFPGLKIDLSNRTVEVNRSPVNLTTKEFDLLALLAGQPNRFFSSDQLVEYVWNQAESVDQRSLMVHLSNLRKKIETTPANPKYIITVRGVGYKFSNNN